MSRPSSVYNYQKFDSVAESEFEDSNLSLLYTPPKKDASIREQIWFIINSRQGRGTMKGKIYRIFMLVTVLIGLGSFIASTEPSAYANGPSKPLLALEVFSVVCWTFDFVLRLACAPVWYKWLKDIPNLLELLFIGTFYAYIVSSPGPYGEGNFAFHVVRTLQTFRAFQIFRLLRLSSTIKIVIQTAKKCKDAFGLLLVLIVLIVLISASLVFYAEQTESHFDHETQSWYRHDGTKSPFQSIATTMWWSMVTISTVGYGDAYPVTNIGKIIASVTMVFALLTLALPIGIFGAHFAEEWRTHAVTKEDTRKKKLREIAAGEAREMGEYGLKSELETLQFELLKCISDLSRKEKTLSDIILQLSAAEKKT